MKKNKLLALLIVISYILPLHGETAFIPGDINRICYYTDFFHNFPSNDFFYYLNDLLLFREIPDGTVLINGLRDKLLTIISQYKLIKKFLRRVKGNEADIYTFNTSSSRGYKKLSAILNLLGLVIERISKDRYFVTSNQTPGVTDYYRFSLLKPSTITRKLNKNRYFKFKVKESEVPVPWDYGFLSEITGIKIDSASFFETMLKNKRFSLLLGLLYRLSDREINYIGSLVKGYRYRALKKIYKDKQFLMGLFILSDALRVTEDHQWAMPGGPDTQIFWSKLAEVDYKKSPLEFLRSLATKDEGKLNYLYLFSYFLPPETQKALFTGANAKKMENLYYLISLTPKEKLNKSQFPRFNNFNFYTLLYSLRMKGHRFFFPRGVNFWLKIIKATDISRETSADLFDLLSELLVRSKRYKKPFSDIQKFVSIYTKFYKRPQLITKDILAWMYRNYDKYNILVDFIEKIPIRKPGTVMKLFDMIRNIEKLNKGDKVLFTSLFQSIFETFSHVSKYAPNRYDFDALMGKVADIPCVPSYLYDKVFEFFRKELNIDPDERSLIDFVLDGIDNRILTIDGTDYKFIIKDIFEKNIEEIFQTQEVCPLATLFEINRLLDNLLKEKGNTSTATIIAGRIIETFHQLPHAKISKDAPKHIQVRVRPYSKTDLDIDLINLEKNVRKGTSNTELKSNINKIKRNYLLQELNYSLLTLVYAINAKNSKLKLFSNPNLVRLHDFTEHNGHTAWNYCGTPSTTDSFSEYHISGGLSRLNIAFTSKWQDHLLRLTYIHDRQHVQSVFLNLLDLYPLPLDNEGVTYYAQLVDFGLEKLRKARENETARKDLIKVLGKVTAGHHYRKTVHYLTGKSNEHNLFFSEIKKLGETFSRNPRDTNMENGNHGLGNIYYHIFGNLVPRQFKLFPQNLSTFLGSGSVSGEMVDEFKIKLSWHIHKNKLPSFLLGQVLYSYVNAVFPRFYSQNYPREYFSTYFMSQIFNDSHLKKIIENLKKGGYLKLK